MQRLPDQASARFTSRVPPKSTIPVSIVLQMTSENCYLELRRGPRIYTTSPIFSVGESNGTSTIWSSGSQSNEQQSLVSSALEQATATSEGSTPNTPRPDLRLPSDSAEDQYVLDDGTKCLDVSGTQSNSAECWEKLQLSQWLPAWVRYKHEL